MTERFLPEEKAGAKALKALRAHLRDELAGATWLDGAGRLVGIGGTVRNLAAAAQKAADLPSYGVQGFRLERTALEALIEELAGRPAAERGSVPGIKPDRGDVILAGAVTVHAVLEAGGFDAIEVTEAGMREGVFFEWYLDGLDPPLLGAVREASVYNLARALRDRSHPRRARGPSGAGHVRRPATAGLHPGDRAERELLWAAAICTTSA